MCKTAMAMAMVKRSGWSCVNQAATEQDPKKLSILVVAIISALDAKQKRLDDLRSNGNPVPDSPAQT